MRGLVLTGPTGVGKSTVQAELRDRHGFWVPRTCTTRHVEPGEVDTIRLDEAEFLRAVRAGEIVLPASFSAYWYGWLREDLAVLRSGEQPPAVNVRPYAALMLTALVERLVAVWLTLDHVELAKRRAGRGAARDVDPTLRARREAEDEEDLVYRACFEHRVEADAHAIPRLLELIRP